jgi:putative aldouronate transport system substrate-binding protein
MTLAAQFYVATTGNDDHDGSKETPFLTITKAQMTVRDFIHNGMNHDVIVFLYGGTYYLEETWQLDERDSGRDGYRVTYCNVPGEEVNIVGGRAVTNWEPYQTDMWRSWLGAGSSFHTMYADGERTKSLVIQKQFIDKYKLDVNSIKTYKDIEPFLKSIKDNEKDVIPFGMAQNSWGLYTDPNLVAADGLAVAYKKDDKAYTSISKIQQLQNKKDFFTTMHNWSKAGYINEDAPLLKNITDLKKKGKVAVSLEFTTKPGGEVDEMANNGGNAVVYVPISDSYFTGVASAMQVISKTSKNPERALMIINLINTDKVLYNLIANGVEGKHYTKKDDKYIEPIKDSGYAPNVDWVFGNQFNAYLKGAQTADVWDKTIKLNQSAMVPASYGFDVNRDTIKSEVANVTAVDNEFQVALETGAVDPADQLQKYIDKLKAAGQDKDAETTKQWQAFLKAKGL